VQLLDVLQHTARRFQIAACGDPAPLMEIAMSESSAPGWRNDPDHRITTRPAGVLVRTSHQTYCPFKGHACYFSLINGPENAVWSYEQPYDEMMVIKDRLAFYPAKVDSIAATAEQRDLPIIQDSVDQSG
jgi:hypothetical protein